MSQLLYELTEDFLAILFPVKTIRSEKNGNISIQPVLGGIRIMVGGCFQSGPYIDKMFRLMISRIPKKHSVKNVLLLGLGGGGAIQKIHDRFPNAHILAVEYDSVMVEIAKTIYLKPEDWKNVEVIVDDARAVLAHLDQTFDLVIVDLFIGQSLSPLLETDDFVKQLIPRLGKDGYMLMNFFRQKKSVAPIFDRYFSRWENLWFKTNQMSVYRHFGQGCAGDPLPGGYKDKRESEIYLKRSARSVSTQMVGNESCRGIRTTIGPIAMEEYVSNEEPPSTSQSFFTKIWWQPLTDLQKTGWWHNPFFIIDHYQKGIGVVTEKNKESYFEHWSDHAKRHRTKWLRDARFEMMDIPFEEFEQAYHTTGRLNVFQRNECMWILKFHVKDHPKDVRLFGARDKKTNEIVAGLALVQYDDIKQSVHTTSFINRNVRHTSVGVGLIDHWYKKGIEEGMRFFNFGNVWKKGDPRAWKGYSQFKRQFDLYLLIYPTPLVKIVWSWKK